MKRCPTCDKEYGAPVNFCPNDGTPLHLEGHSPDTEAVTKRMEPKLSAQDIVMEIADHLRKTVERGEQALIRFDPLTGLGLSMAEISEHFEAAAEKAECEVISKTDTRATVRRDPGIYIA